MRGEEDNRRLQFKRYRATLVFDAFTEGDPALTLEQRIRQCVETHPTASFAVDRVSVEECEERGEEL